MTPDTEIRGTVGTDRLRESPLNPRKHYDEGELRGLAASITANGVLQPLLVRPVPATATLASGEWVGLKHFEIVAGHRRFRAARLAKVEELPVTVRAISDADAKAMMLTENINREGLRPSEEAGTLAELVKALGLERAAEKVGKPASYVRERESLARLPAWFLAAVDAGLVPASTAAVVARVPGEESREKAAVCVAAGLDGPPAADWRDEWLDHSGEDGPALSCDYTRVLTYRDAKQLVRTHFSRELKGAPFSRKALDLVPEAGSCDACPKRAGNDEDLKAEGVRADTCTDPECFEKKLAAYKAAEVARWAKKHEVVGPVEPVDGWRGDRPPRGHCDVLAPLAGGELDDGSWGKKASASLAEVLGGAGGWEKGLPKLASFDAKGKLRTLVRTAEARKRLQGAGLMARPEKRVPLGDEEVSLRAGKGKGKEPVADVLWRVIIDLEALGPVEFEAPAERHLAGGAPGLIGRAWDALAAAFESSLAMSWEEVPDGEEADLRPRSCRVCGCTEADCSQCVEKTGSPCSWAEADLCSACVSSAPPVHEPGNLPLAKLPGLNPSDVQCLLACDFRTLADLGRACGGDLDRVEEVLEKLQGAFRPSDVARVAKAVRGYLDATPEAEVRTPAPLTAAAYNARVADLKAASDRWFADDGVRDELDDLWGGGCNSFGVLVDGKEETVARAGKAVVKVTLVTGPCGLWVSSYSADAGTSGSSGSPCLTDTAYDTREAAREAALRKALAWCGSHQETSGVEKTKALAAKLADQLRVLLGEAPAKKAKKQPAKTLSN